MKYAIVAVMSVGVIPANVVFIAGLILVFVRVTVRFAVLCLAWLVKNAAIISALAPVKRNLIWEGKTKGRGMGRFLQA